MRNHNLLLFRQRRDLFIKRVLLIIQLLERIAPQHLPLNFYLGFEFHPAYISKTDLFAPMVSLLHHFGNVVYLERFGFNLYLF